MEQFRDVAFSYGPHGLAKSPSVKCRYREMLVLLFFIVFHKERHVLAKSPSVKCRYGEGSCYMFDMEQVLILSRYLSMTVCIIWLEMAGETGMPRAPASVKERPFAISFPMA